MQQNVIGVVHNMSPLERPRAKHAMCSADVALFAEIENLLLQYFLISFSNFSTMGPLVKKSDFKTLTTFLISLLSILCLP